MAKLRAENISKRLFGAMLVIVLSLLFISVPLIFKSYQHYQQAQLALTEIQSLRTVAELSNKISRERAPSNKVMSSTPEEYAQNREELAEYRRGVDQHIQSTIVQLNATGFYTEASEIATQLQPQLQQGRAAVDAYAALPRTARSMQQLDAAILKMFSAWDESHNILKHMVIHSQSQDEYTSNYHTLILILADLRDQAGRVASNIIAPVTFKEKCLIPIWRVPYRPNIKRVICGIWSIPFCLSKTRPLNLFNCIRKSKPTFSIRALEPYKH